MYGLISDQSMRFINWATEKRPKYYFKRNMGGGGGGEGAEYSTYFQNVFEKLCFICEIFFIFLKYFIVCLFGFFFFNFPQSNSRE